MEAKINENFAAKMAENELPPAQFLGFLGDQPPPLELGFESTLPCQGEAGEAGDEVISEARNPKCQCYAPQKLGA